MSIIIKGVKMPESCGTCFVGNRTICKNGCPLVALPDKHGELIDRGKLLRDIEHYHLSDGKFQHWVEVQNTIVEAEDEP